MNRRSLRRVALAPADRDHARGRERVGIVRANGHDRVLARALIVCLLWAQVISAAHDTYLHRGPILCKVGTRNTSKLTCDGEKRS